MGLQQPGCWEAAWVLGEWLGLRLVLGWRLLAWSSQEAFAASAAAAGAAAGRCSWLEGSSAGPGEGIAMSMSSRLHKPSYQSQPVLFFHC